MTFEATSRAADPQSFDFKDRLLSVLLVLSAVAFTGKTIHWHTAPAEDALMLLRYSTHLSVGSGITWNIGDRPLEGATDFLYMAVVAGLMKLFHSGAILTARVFLLICHCATVLLVYAGARKLFLASRAFAFALALYLMLGPGVLLASGAFSGPFYALAAMASWWFACAMVVDHVTPWRIWAFALLALITALIRPDGVLLAVFMTCVLAFGLVTSNRRTEAFRVIGMTAAIFVLLGGSYFLWRFHYFGYLLPNPFYKKGGGHLYPQSLHFATLNTFKMLLPVVPVALIGLAVREFRRTFFVFSTTALFSLIWILLNNENNWMMRFQYVTIPLTLMTVPFLTRHLHQRFFSQYRFFGLNEIRALGVVALTTVMLGGVYWKTLYSLPFPDNGSGAYNIAIGLHQWQNRHYTMVVTEAGVIPYFSEWRAIDAWGLNDSVIVHDKRGLTEEYLDANQPAIIMFHLVDAYGRDSYTRIWNGDTPIKQDPAHFMEVLGHYPVSHNYELAARWGKPCNVHVWYVRRGLPETDAMVALIRRSPHFFLDDGWVARDYRNDAPPVACDDPGFKIPLGS